MIRLIKRSARRWRISSAPPWASVTIIFPSSKRACASEKVPLILASRRFISSTRLGRYSAQKASDGNFGRRLARVSWSPGERATLFSASYSASLSTREGNCTAAVTQRFMESTCIVSITPCAIVSGSPSKLMKGRKNSPKVLFIPAFFTLNHSQKQSAGQKPGAQLFKTIRFPSSARPPGDPPAPCAESRPCGTPALRLCRRQYQRRLLWLRRDR